VKHDGPIIGCALMTISAMLVVLVVMGVLHLLYGI